MTIPKPLREIPKRVSDMVRGMVPHMRWRLTKDEQQLAVYLRGNEPMFEALKAMIESRITGRASLPEPSDPLACKSILARDREAQAIIARLEHVYRSPVSEPAEDSSEQPAA